MADEKNGLDDFLSSNNNKKKTPKVSPEKKETDEDDLEDAFSKLLNDFISQSSENKEKTERADKNADSLGDSKSTEESGLDDFVTIKAPEQTRDWLDSLADSNQEKESEDNLEDFINENEDSAEEEKSSSDELDDFVSSQDEEENSEDNNSNELKAEENELAQAVANFQDSITAIASRKKYKLPKTDYEEKMLIPNYKPSIGKKIAQYLLDCWEILNKYAPEEMKKLSPDATDEDYLNFAESLNDAYLQLAIISYVEILINMEICENSYQQKKEEMQKRRIRRELYEEYLDLQERKQMFIEKLKEKDFPIDANNLINNYFRVAQKDADGSFEALTKNPATFSPIQVEKIRPKFFGLIKVTPEDGIKANQKIGKFIKKLKV